MPDEARIASREDGRTRTASRGPGPLGAQLTQLTQKHNHGPKTHKLRQSRKG